MCSYCPQNLLMSRYKKISNTKYMSTYDFIGLMDTLPSYIDIHFTGMCEPFLNHDCTYMVKEAAEYGHSVGISTTWMGLRKSDIAELENMQFKFFTVHLPSTGDKFFSTTALRNLKKSKIDAKYHYHKELHPNIIKALKGIDVVKALTHSRANNVGHSKVYNKSKLTCTKNFKQNVLLPNGDLALCCMDYGLEYIVGNLFKKNNSLLQIWDSTKYLETVERARNNLCRYCEMYAVEAR